MNLSQSISSKSSVPGAVHIVSGDLWGGAEAMACNLIRHLQNDWDVRLCVVSLNHGQLAERLAASGVQVRIFDERRHSFGEILSNIRKVIHEFQPDLIHSHRYKENILALLARGARGRTGLVATQHGLPELGSRPSPMKRLLHWSHYRLLARYFSRVVAVSADLGRYLTDEKEIPAERIEVIHNGIELPEYREYGMKRGERFVVGSCGRLVEVKDYGLFCRVAAAAGEGMEFRLAGDGPQRAHLEALARTHNLGKRFRMDGERRDMNEFYAGIDLYLSTSRHEGIPLTVIEAMASGVPVVVPAVGGLTEMIEDGVEGFLVPDRQPESFAARCRQILENRGLWERMSRAARMRAERCFSARTMAEHYYRMYRRIVV